MSKHIVDNTWCMTTSYTKIGDSRFSRSGDMVTSVKIENGSFNDSSFSRSRDITEAAKFTRGSAIAEEPRDELRQLKYYGRFFD